jgi:transposase
MLDACVYVLRSGCSWRMLPKDFPPWAVVYRTIRRWQARGLFERVNEELRVLRRSGQHRNPDPSGVVLDPQSVHTTARVEAAREGNGSLAVRDRFRSGE